MEGDLSTCNGATAGFLVQHQVLKRLVSLELDQGLSDHQFCTTSTPEIALQHNKTYVHHDTVDKGPYISYLARGALVGEGEDVGWCAGWSSLRPTPTASLRAASRIGSTRRGGLCSCVNKCTHTGTQVTKTAGT